MMMSERRGKAKEVEKYIYTELVVENNWGKEHEGSESKGVGTFENIICAKRIWKLLDANSNLVIFGYY